MRFTVLGVLLLGGFLGVGMPSAQAQGVATAAPVAATGRIEGVVRDEKTQQPVGYATVVVLPADSTDNKPVTGVAASDEGSFSIDKLPEGSYRLRASFVGYASRTRTVAVSAGSPFVVVFRLAPAATALTEAVVIGSKPIVDVRPDRLIYNADQDVTNAGGTAADVLRKAPLLAVDGEGKVTMRGSANFRVLVNNKPSPTMAANLADALKSLPADQIQSVEIITTPPAKYDGEGTAGIINIVLKKGAQQNLNGRVGASSGNRNTNMDAWLNFRKGKIGFTSSASVGRWYNPGEFNLSRTGLDSNGNATSDLALHGDNYNNGGWYYGTAGLDFDPAEHHSFSLAGSVNGWGGDNTRTTINRFTALDASQNYLFTRDDKNQFTGINAEATGTYTRTFAQARREWSVLGQYANNSNSSGYDFDQYANSAVVLTQNQASYRERARNQAPSHEITAQTDFVQPFGDKQTLETGLKSIWRRNSSVADIDTLVTDRASDFARSQRRATDFRYDQNVQAAYATYSFSASKKLSLSLGSRVERTSLSADFRTTDTGFRRSYVTPLPNGNAQYAFSEATSLRLAYSRRITRPNIYYLNPYVDRSDPSTINYGNPNLDPELTDSYELSYNTGFKTTSLNASLSVRHTGNAIEQVRLRGDSASVTEQTFANVAANTFYQFNLYGSVKITPKWDLSGGPDVQYIVRRSPALNADRHGFTGGINLNTSYKFAKTFTVSAFAFGSLSQPDIQGRGPANLYYGFGAKKTFRDDRLEVSLNIANPFNEYWPYRNLLSTSFFTETNEYRAYQRAFRVSVGYRFGQDKGGRQRKTIRNDDVKGGGSKQGG